MQESTLVKASLIVSLFGLTILFFLSRSMEMDVSSIEEVKGMDDFSETVIEGTVTGVYKSDNVTILYLSELQEVKAVVFEDVNLTEGQFVQVKGEVTTYNGEKEIKASRIRIVG